MKLYAVLTSHTMATNPITHLLWFSSYMDLYMRMKL